MTAQRRRLDALDALARDPGATEAERALAAEHAAKIRAQMGVPTGTRVFTKDWTEVVVGDVEVDVPDDLVAAMDRAMARAARVKSPRYRAARIRAAEQRLGRQTSKQWREGRGPELRR